MLKKHFGGGSAYLFAIIGNLTVQFIATIVFSIALEVNGKDLSQDTITNLIIMLLIQLVFFAVYFLFIIKPKEELRYPIKKQFNPLWIPVCMLLALMCILAFYSPTYLFAFILEKLGYTQTGGLELNTFSQYFLGVIILIIAAPVCEELIFRSALLSKLSDGSSKLRAALFTALAFMLIHMSPDQTVYQFLLGLVLCFSVFITKSPYPAMLIHSFSNLFALIMDVPAVNAKIEVILSPLGKYPALAVIAGILSFIIFSVLILLVLKLLKIVSGKKNKNARGGEKVLVVEAKKPNVIAGIKRGLLELTGNISGNDGLNNEEELTALTDEELESRAVSNYEKKRLKIIYITGIVICIVMWISSLIYGFTVSN